jgi:hypothetical protein
MMQLRQWESNIKSKLEAGKKKESVTFPSRYLILDFGECAIAFLEKSRAVTSPFSFVMSSNNE